MPILALDTATMVSSVAIASPDKLLAEVTLQTKLTHSEVLMPHVQQVLAMANIKKTELDAIAVSVGPGSFTGLRIGLAAAKSSAGYGNSWPFLLSRCIILMLFPVFLRVSLDMPQYPS